MPQELIDAIVEMDDRKALQLAEDLLNKGTSAEEILLACQQAMVDVGRLFEEGEYFLPELIMGGEILKQVTEIIKPNLSAEGKTGEKAGKVVFGTVAGDIHDIGKDIVIFVLETNNFEVIDLGVDVPVKRFVEAVKEEKPNILGLSGFLTKTFETMKETIDAISKAGLRDDLKIMIGGGTVSEDVVGFVGADSYGETAMDGVNIAKSWMGGK